MNVEEDLQTAAWIARQVGVGRAAVANWRKRYPDFPQPAAGGANSPLFSWSAVQAWLVENGKAGQLAATGRTVTGTQLIGDAPSVQGLDRDLSDLEPGELLARVLVSLLPRLGDDAPDDDRETLVVLDPACRDAAVLTAVAERYCDHVRLAAQAPDDTAADTVRRVLPAVGDLVRVGDALRTDLFAASRGTARAVLCVPPPAMRQWPATDLAADPRWRYGLPDPADPDLAWVQHCLAHLRPGGVAVVVVSPVTGQRPSGRHVRAALVRAGVVRDVIALPDGLAEGAVHLWVLRRGGDEQSVRMVDLTGLEPADVPQDHAAWKPVLAADDQALVRSVPQVELLDGDTPLVPARYLRPAASLDDLGPVTARLGRLYVDLARALPQPTPASSAAGRSHVTLAELERSRAITILPRDATPRAGDLLFRTMGRDPVVADGTADDERGVAQVVGIDTDRLDPHFVAMFVRADARAAPVANTHSALTRDDVRRCRIPRMPLIEQRRYGDAFRRLSELTAVAARLAAVTDAVVTQTVHGLTAGALDPAALGAPGTIEPPENEKRTQ
ncbi:MAG: N-6 DNA methylase [Pseudonocardia sp.]|nr:N-6 DNA methylase [Pseudonocardia sp.]